MNRRLAAGVLFLATTMPLLMAASARAAEVRSTPPAGSSQRRVPPRVMVQFSEQQTRTSHLEVFDPCGKRVDKRNSVVAGARVTVGIGATASGRYLVRYFGVSAIDGHATRGTFRFTVRGVGGCEAADVPAPAKPGRGIWDLPKADFAVALGVAALIGALGGLVYASILGPRT